MMRFNRRELLRMGPGMVGISRAAGIPAADGRPLCGEPFFPSRLHAFVWRNWELVGADRMARVVHTSPEKIRKIGVSMGLRETSPLSGEDWKRIYITVIRQNWHLLPNTQIMELLDWDQKKFAFTLKEDDFLDVKLGRKPDCPRLAYHSPSGQERAAAARVRRILEQELGAAFRMRGEPPFEFIRRLSDPHYSLLRLPSATAEAGEVDLTAGWCFPLPPDNVPKKAVLRLREYLETAMGCRLARENGQRDCKRIRLEIDSSGSGEERFRIFVTEEEVRVTGSGPAGLIRGIYRLEDRMEQRGGPFLKIGTTSKKAVWDPRYIYSYFALYGDPLMETGIDPFPPAYLEKLARAGINGVWMQAVLNTLAPSKRFPEFGEGWETRLRNLHALTERTAEFGIKVYLYINEPRAMPPAFFERHPGIRGSPYKGLYAMCTSTTEVREWITKSIEHVMRHVPELGGWFSITMSENHTNCFSHGGAWGRGAPVATGCPRCSRRKSWDVLAELIGTFRDGVRNAGSSADVIAWDWGWGDALAEHLLPLLPHDIRFLSVSEWAQPVERGGVHATVGEYSISVVGPGPRARRNWALAQRHGLKTMAKTQFNNTWEISAVPYIPVPPLITRHCAGLRKAGISGLMASWTLGGYPSPNLDAAKAYYSEPGPGSEKEILLSVARRRYGVEATPDILEGWRRFSAAFEEFPYGVRVYIIPTQHGPANLLRFHPSGYRPGMILFPEDDVAAWSGIYPPEVVWEQFSKMTILWKSGLEVFRRGIRKVPVSRRATAETDLAIAETCGNHFESTANQVRFYILRGELETADPARRKQILDEMRTLAEREIELARRQFQVARRNSLIAYEASNHYYYRPLDLAEKILNCRYILDEVIPAV